MVIIYGKCILDNIHCQEDELTYEELLLEDARDLVTCTETAI